MPESVCSTQLIHWYKLVFHYGAVSEEQMHLGELPCNCLWCATVFLHCRTTNVNWQPRPGPKILPHFNLDSVSAAGMSHVNKVTKTWPLNLHSCRVAPVT